MVRGVSWLRVVLFVILLASRMSGIARAQPDPVAGSDVVVQRDGVLLRGQVAELRPYQSVTLILLGGEKRIVPWGDIARFSGPSFRESGLSLPDTRPVVSSPGLPPSPRPEERRQAPQPSLPDAVSPPPGAASRSAVGVARLRATTLAAPQVLSPEDGAAVTTQDIAVRVRTRAAPGPSHIVRVFVDGRPAAEARALVSSGGPGVSGADRPGERVLKVSIPARDCTLTILSEDGDALSPAVAVRLRYVSAGYVARPKLYVLAVGVSQYRQYDLSLRFAAKDAMDFAAALKTQDGQLYGSVQTRVLTDDMATREGILEGLDWLRRQTTNRDVAMLLLAGHGINDPSTGTYYMLPYDADETAMSRTLVSQEDIRRALGSIAGKALLFLDTCHAGKAFQGDRIPAATRSVADINPFVRELVLADNGVVVYAATTGRQVSQESSAWQNGVFTKAVVEGLLGRAAYQPGRPITLSMLELYVSERVKELTRGSQTPTVAKPSTLADFPIALGSQLDGAGPVGVAPPRVKAGPLMLGLRLGPALLVGESGGALFAAALDIGYAVDAAQSLYVVLSPRVSVNGGWIGGVGAGLQYDLALPWVRGLYLYPRIQIGYANLASSTIVPVVDPKNPLASLTKTVNAAMLFGSADLGIKYVPRLGRGRLALIVEPVSITGAWGKTPDDASPTDPRWSKTWFHLIEYRALVGVGLNLEPRPSVQGTTDPT